MIIEDVNLSSDQDSALQEILNFKEGFCFVTGDAGTGKSTLLRKLRTLEPSIVLAPTGIAALIVGGQTIHSFFGLRPGSKYAMMSNKSKEVLRNVKRVIIDEISMVRSDLMQIISNAMQKNLDSSLPFGGIPVVAFGDLMQIEPVVASKEEFAYLKEKFGGHFFFEADCIKFCKNVKFIKLTEVFRQQTDPKFIEALQSIRMGSTQHLNFFNSRIKEPEEKTLKITFTNKKSNSINQFELEKISSDSHIFEGKILGELTEKELPAEKIITLKVGARVMLLVNFPKTYVNGDLGEILEIGKDSIKVQLDRGPIVDVTRHNWEKIAYSYSRSEGLKSEVVAEYIQYPIRLAYALTCHKCQGQTFDTAHLELETTAFAHGLLYVSLSRVKTLEGLTLSRKLYQDDILIDRRAVNWELKYLDIKDDLSIEQALGLCSIGEISICVTIENRTFTIQSLSEKETLQSKQNVYECLKFRPGTGKSYVSEDILYSLMENNEYNIIKNYEH